MDYLNRYNDDGPIWDDAAKAEAMSAKPADYQWAVMPNRNMQIKNLIQKRDRNFYPIPILDYAKRLYVSLQEAWMKGNAELVRDRLTDSYLQELKELIEQHYNPKLEIHIENISFPNAYLTFYRMENGMEYITVYMEAQMERYATGKTTGRIVSGNKEDRETMVNLMEFVRPVDGISDVTVFTWKLSDFLLSAKGTKDLGMKEA